MFLSWNNYSTTTLRLEKLKEKGIIDIMTGIKRKVLAFDIDQTLNIAKTPIPSEIAILLTELSKYFVICPISGQKFEQFIIQIVEPMKKAGASAENFKNLHLFVAQGTQYYRFNKKNEWEMVYNHPLTVDDVVKITTVLEKSAKEFGYWEEDKLIDGDEIIENRGSQITFSALGQKASTKEKYEWDPDHHKRNKITKQAKELLPDFDYEVAGTTSINVFKPGMNKEFGMNKLMEFLGVSKSDILYFGDMTQEGGNDYPVVAMGIDTITVRSHEDTEFALLGILNIVKNKQGE